MQNSFNYNDLSKQAYNYLKDQLHYKYTTIRHYRYRWLPVKDFMEENGISSLDSNVCFNYIIKLLGGRTHEQLIENEKLIVKSVSVLQEFIETGKFVPKKKIRHLDGEIGTAIKEYLDGKEKQGIRKNTIEKNEAHYSSFNLFLARNNVLRIKDIKPKYIIDFIGVLDVKHPAKIHDTLSDLRQFFIFLYNRNYIDADLEKHVPRDNYLSNSKLPSYYSEQELMTLLDYIDRGTKVGKRDYAIINLAARLGLRASDIAFLKFSNLKWENSTINLTQYKTGQKLILPILPHIGNSILDYIQYGRDKSNQQYIFLQAIFPFKPMTPQSISGLVQRHFKNSGLPILYRRHGCHALRHSLVKELLMKGQPLPIITEVLGHKNIESTKHYIRIDESKLRLCVLDVPPVSIGFYKEGGNRYE